MIVIILTKKLAVEVVAIKEVLLFSIKLPLLVQQIQLELHLLKLVQIGR